MNNVVDDGFLRSLDAFLGTVYWSEEPITLEVALVQAIDDWVAMASAEHNESKPFAEAAPADSLESCLRYFLAAIEVLASSVLPSMTISVALSVATADWLADVT